jgi:ubiquinone/menaquinone biosynthesis C-methylase UbiE
MTDSDPWADRVRRGYDVVSRAYRADHDSPDVYASWLQHLDAVLSPSSAVIDLGCGCGVPVARHLAEAGHHATGVDISAVQIERGRQLVPDASFVCHDLTEVSFKDGLFDAAVFLYSIIHLPLAHQPLVLSRVARWLRPGGTLLLTAGVDAWTGSEQRWLGTSATMWWSQADAATYRHWLIDAGFTILDENLVPDGLSAHTSFWAERSAA